MISEDRIIKIAEEAGLDTHPPLKLVEMGNGTMKFVKPKELTIYGEKILEFARLIERETLEDIKKGGRR